MLSKKQLLKVVGYLLIIIMCYYLIKTTDFRVILSHMKYIGIETFLLLIGLQLVTQVLLTIQWHFITHAILEKSSFLKILQIFARGTIIEAITPGAKIGGEVTRLYLLKKEFQCDTDKALNIIIIQKSISMSVLFTICVISFLHISRNVADYFSFVIQFLLITLSVLVITLMILFLLFADYLSVIISKSQNKFIIKLNRFVLSYADSIKKLKKLHWYLQFAISMVVWILFPVKMVILAKALDIRLPFFIIIAITMTSYMMGMLPITPGGVGTFEGTMYALLALFSVDLAVSVTTTILFRFITFWFVILYSGVIVIIYQLKISIEKYKGKQDS